MSASVRIFAALVFVISPALAQCQQTQQVKNQGETKPLPLSSPPPMKEALDKSWYAVSPDCGANSLYMFLRLRGVTASLDQIRKEVPVTGKGASLLDLKRAADKNGILTSVVSSSTAALAEMAPVIARMTGTGKDESDGHYVVLVQVNDRTIAFIDGTSGALVHGMRGNFERKFSGYALVTGENSSQQFWRSTVRTSLLAVCAIEAMAIIIISWRRYSVYRQRQRKQIA